MISFAGVELLQDSPQADVQEFLHANQEMYNQFFPPPHAALSLQPLFESWRGSVGESQPRDTSIRSGLNKLCWPGGVMRYATFLGICDGDRLKRVIASLVAGSNKGLLTLEDIEQDVRISTEMYMLTPRHITVSCDLRGVPLGTVNKETTKDGVSLWLLPLVDDRYFLLQSATAADKTVANNSTWKTEIETLAGEMPIVSPMAADDAQTADWGRPIPSDTHRFEWQGQNFMRLLETLSASCGQRITKRLNGSYFSRSFTTDFPVWLAQRPGKNSKKAWNLIAGGTMEDYRQGITPREIDVYFDSYNEGVIRSGRPLHKQSRAANQIDDPLSMPMQGQPAKQKGILHPLAIRSTAVADREGTSSEGDPPVNLADLEVLTNNLAEAWYKWNAIQYDYTFAGLMDWTPTGFDDYVEWEFLNKRGIGQQPITRVHSREYAYVISEQIQWLTDLAIVRDSTFGTLDSNLDANDQSTVTLPERQITVFDKWGFDRAQGEIVHLHYDLTDDKWYVHYVPDSSGNVWAKGSLAQDLEHAGNTTLLPNNEPVIDGGIIKAGNKIPQGAFVYGLWNGTTYEVITTDTCIVPI